MRLATGLALMLTLVAGSVRAEDVAPADHCAGPSIVLQPPLNHRRSWTRAAGDTRRRIAELSDVDACTRLEIEATDESVQVRASAADGRSVVREVSKPSELEATVVALLVLPPAERDETLAAPNGVEASTSLAAPKSEASSKPTAAAAPERAPRKLEPRNDRARSAELPSANAARGRPLELALEGSGRSSGYLLGAGASGIVDWNLNGWLLGAALHAEQVSGPNGVSGRFSAERSASLGALFGRRLLWRPFYLDVALEAPVLALRTSKWTSQSVTTAPPVSESDDVPGGNDDGITQGVPTTTTTARTQATTPNLDLRAGGIVRAVVPFAGRLGATLTLDGERSLGLLKATSVSGEPAALPWNFGVSLGVFWSGG